MSDMTTALFVSLIVQWLIVPLFSPLVIGIINKIKATLQGRRGAGILQPYRNLHKLFRKDEVLSRDASWIFRATPLILFVITLVIGASIPLATALEPMTAANDFLTIIYLFALGTFFLALAGMDTGSPFGGFGSSREMTVAALAEGGLILSLVVPVVLAGTTNIFSVSQAVAGLPISTYLYLLFGFVGYFIALLAETGRFPFDNPATHLELTMIHEAMILEYSGRRLALIEWAAASKLMIFLSLGVNLFFPWGIANSTDPVAIAYGLVVLLGKVLVLAGLIAIIESSMAKYRYFRLPDLLVTSLVLSAIALILVV